MANDVFIQLDADYINQLTWFGCLYCLSPKTVQICLTLLQYAHYESRWIFVDYFPHDDEQRAIQWDLYQSWVDQAEKELMDCQDSASSAEYVSYDDNGNRICSTDGSTWYICNSGDPRFTGAIPPGGTGANKECAGADNIIVQVQQFKSDIYDLLAGSATVVEFIAAIIAAVASALSFGIATPVVLALANALVGIASTVFDAEIDSDALEVFRCILYCAAARHSGDERLIYTADDYNYIIHQIDLQLTTTVQNAFFRGFMLVHGPIGLTLFSRMGNAAGDDCDTCGDCPAPWCRLYTPREGAMQGWDLIHGVYDATSHRPGSDGTGSYPLVYVEIKQDFGVETFATQLSFDYAYDNLGSGGYVQAVLKLSGTTVLNTGTGNAIDHPTGTFVVDVSGVSFDTIELYAVPGDSGVGYATISNVTLSGEVAPVPTTGDDCP